ncbi:MAG: hypothetical protein M1817_005649 [Caeruleum heppii]|nr:MAG: hypothetical protein M1817_005649 [Caeruleum heppii]
MVSAKDESRLAAEALELHQPPLAAQPQDGHSNRPDRDNHDLGAEPSGVSRLSSSATIAGVRRSASDPEQTTLPAASPIHVRNTSSAAIRLSPDRSPRVRFSEDTERRPRSISTSDDAILGLQGPAAQKTAVPGSPLRTPTLSLDLMAAKGEHEAGKSKQLNSPVSSETQVRHQSRRLAHPSHPSNPPTSPGTRGRGYSLRRSLFAKSVQSPTGAHGPAIELATAGPSKLPLRLTNRPPESDKKSSQPAVAVTPQPKHESPSKEFDRPSILPNYETWMERQRQRSRSWQRIRTWLDQGRKSLLRINAVPPSQDGRHILLEAQRKEPLLDERTGREYISNTVRSCRYTLWNFLPRQLFAQFSKLANFYFLSISILQMIPNLSTTGTFTTIVPLLFFVGLSMAKEGYDDLRRHRLDKAENDGDAQVFRTQPGQRIWKTTKWRAIRVGDLVRLRRDEAVPADLILLRATGPNGVAYIETMALDGETNLKSKSACPLLAGTCWTDTQIDSSTALVVVEDPNLDLYNFEGNVTVAGATRPLSGNEVLYRGSVLRNTAEAIGMVIYTGEECKIRMNATKNPRIKAPQLQAKVNRIVIVIVIFVLALAVFNTVAYQIWSEQTEDRSWYLRNARVSGFPIFASFVIMFNTLIPLSLYVSLEIVKLAQMFLMNDIDMYHEASNTPMEARTSTINEELGQVSYLFSDKTGTLTNNSMGFRKMSVAGTAWLHDFDLHREHGSAPHAQNLSTAPRKGKGLGEKGQHDPMSHDAVPTGGAFAWRAAAGEVSRETPTASRWRSSARPGKAQPEMRTQELLHYLEQYPDTAFSRKARFFLLTIALCHTCLPEEGADGSVDFQAASPDELALVRAARDLGYLVVDRQAAALTLKTFPDGTSGGPTTEVYEVLDVIEFSSKRKRMSVVVRLPNGRICIITKGADSTIMRLLRSSTLAMDKVRHIERKASRRKSLEAQRALRRTSEQTVRRSSNVRTSVTLGRTSLGGFGRPSLAASRLHPIRDEIDAWLTDRERTIDMSSLDDSSAYQTPRPSVQGSARQSFVNSEPRSSRHLQELDDPLAEASAADENDTFERCFQHVNDFATEGLRTLLYGYRYLDEEEYAGWKKIYLDATTSLTERQRRIEEAGALIERELELAGATAIEDKLQVGVPEAIDKLRRANIKLWMLTGDKRETAINIGHSCRLIKDYSTVTVLDHEVGELERYMGAAIIDINRGDVAHSVIVVDGQTLSVVEESATLASLFSDLAILVDSVICCRASPSQKASLVRSIRKKVKHSVTLAIGDGANDIAMIQEAHVGIGITGVEGLQAARTSDYSIAQFRFLLKLLLVHGRWNYVRTCRYTLGTFWKEMLFYLTQALYQRWAGYTGTSLYESWSLSMFNTLFTSLPVIFLGTFEKDLSPSTLLAVPELYSTGQRGDAFNLRVYCGWMFMASAEAMVVFFVMLGLYGQTTAAQDNGLYAMGVMTFTACVVLISMKLLLFEMHNKTIIALLGIVLSVGGWFLWNLLLSVLYHDNKIYNVKGGLLHRFGDTALWWLVLILVIGSCVVFEVGIISLRSSWFPTDADLFQVYEKDEATRRRFDKAASSELQQGWAESPRRSLNVFSRRRKRKTSEELQDPEGMRRSSTSGPSRGDDLGGCHEDLFGHEPDRGVTKSSIEIRDILSRRQALRVLRERRYRLLVGLGWHVHEASVLHSRSGNLEDDSVELAAATASEAKKPVALFAGAGDEPFDRNCQYTRRLSQTASFGLDNRKAEIDIPLAIIPDCADDKGLDGTGRGDM